MERYAELISPRTFVVREGERVAPGPGEVQVCVHACGVCASDVHRFLGSWRQRYPIVLGHEIGGIVRAVGDGVDSVQVGDPVAVVPLLPCFRCARCQAGDFSLCTDYGFLGSRQAGGFATTVRVPERNVVPLPVGITGEAAALVEPLAVASHALRRAGMSPSDSLVILGGGSIGLGAALIARHSGVERIQLLDVSAARVERARLLGFSASPVSESATTSEGSDVVVEAAGSAAAFAQAIRLAKPKGRIACVGTIRDGLSLSAEVWEGLLRKELTAVGVWNSYTAPFPGHDWVAASAVVAVRGVRVEDLVTHRIPLTKVQSCFESLVAEPERFGKVLVCPTRMDEDAPGPAAAQA